MLPATFIVRVFLFRRRTCILTGLGLAIVAMLMPRVAAAQKQAVEVDDLPVGLRSRVVTVESLPRFQTRTLGHAEIDVNSGALRSAFRLALTDSARAVYPDKLNPESAAREYIRRNGSKYGWSPREADLKLLDAISTPVSSHVRFQQQVDGVPVLYRFVKVSLDDAGAPTFVVNGFDKHVATSRPVNRVATSAISTKSQVATLFEVGPEAVAEPALAIYPGEQPSFVWRTLVHSERAGGEWEALVDAESGDLISIRDRSFRRRDLAVSGSRRATDFHTSALFGSGFGAANGTGSVFDPDPLSTAGVPYGSPYVDSGDADQAALNDQRLSVTLNDIELGTDNLYRLIGPYVAIAGGGALSYSPPAEAAADAFGFGRADDRFEAVNAYYHVDKSQRYVQDLGFVGIQNRPVKVNPLALVADNSVYSPSSNMIEFGAGGVDDAEDAGVIWHEYGHALLEASSPGLVDALEGHALHEGWSDYWATSYLRSLVDAGKTARTDWQNVFRWDSGDGQIWPGRHVGIAGTYPDDFHCEDAGDSNHDGCNIYADGLIWASTLMDIYDQVGRNVSDRLAIQSHRYISIPGTFRDAAEGLLQADEDLFDGQYASILLSILGDRGLIDASQFAPVAEHEPLHDSEDLGGTATVRVNAFSANSTVDSVFVIATVDGGTPVRTSLTPVEANVYEAQIALPVEGGSVSYYIEVLDAQHRSTVLPNTAPFDVFTFVVGPDNTAPVIDHAAVETVSLVTWPLTVYATVTDNLAVDTVTVDFELRDLAGTIQDSGSFGLSPQVGSGYSGALPASSSILSEGWTVFYSINATDAAVGANSARSPAIGEYSTLITLSGNLLQYDFESGADQLVATGIWERGTVSNLLQTAHSGSRSWGTSVSASYPATAQLSSLTLPTLSLESLPDVYLVFWHWHDFEHEGPVIPGADNFAASLWDGGNVKTSVDGAPWVVAEPLGGYSGNVVASSANPIAGQRAFGGYSYGWRREIVQLPGGSEVRVRFDFGSDDSNSEESLAFAGWFIDDVSIVTVVPQDVAAPEAVELPPASFSADIDLELPPIVVRAVDDTGIESVTMLIDSDSTTVSIRDTRLGMDFSDPDQYFVQVAPIGITSGDRIAYRFRIRDFDGNEIVVPSASSAPLRIVYKRVEESTALGGAVATGYWSEDGGGYVAAANGVRFARSGLVLAPITLASNADELFVDITHSYVLSSGLGGNLKVSMDDGKHWTVLSPVAGYPATFDGAGHPMDDEAVFAGSQSTTVVSSFDLLAYVGTEIRLSLDFGSAREPVVTEYWSVEDISIRSESTEPELEREYKLALNANYPNPFSTTTTVSYTIPEESVVQIGVYDVLGRRIVVPLFARQSAGAHTFAFDGSSLAAGTYWMRLQVGADSRSMSFVVSR